jgi:hypothetical protein
MTGRIYEQELQRPRLQALHRPARRNRQPYGALYGKYVFGDTMKMVRDSSNFGLKPSVGSLSGNGQLTGDMLRITARPSATKYACPGRAGSRGGYNDRYGIGQIWLKRQ